MFLANDVVHFSWGGRRGNEEDDGEEVGIRSVEGEEAGSEEEGRREEEGPREEDRGEKEGSGEEDGGEEAGSREEDRGEEEGSR